MLVQKSYISVANICKKKIATDEIQVPQNSCASIQG